MKIKTYKELIVWQKGMDLVKEVYKLTEQLPKKERFSLCSQLQRAAVSIPSNIAEEYGRGTRKDYRSFLIIARGSAYEIETQCEVVRMIYGLQTENIIEKNTEVIKILQTIIKKLC